MSSKIVLTGIKPTGKPHLGNYLGAIKPGIALANQPGNTAYYFIADYHALTTVNDPATMREYTYEVAAAWMACGLDPSKTLFYRQSDIPEIMELNWVLACMCPKGFMNRAHAYKAIVQANEEAGNPDVDAGVNMGLFNYPVLMSADIIMFDSNLVPVGKDQKQHVEFARDLAIKFNNVFGEVLVVPAPLIDDHVATVPGLDGRKMSKSYGNTIFLFEEPGPLRKQINKIKTDSTPPEEPKDPETSSIFQFYRAFATAEQTEALRRRYAEGIGWGEAKAMMFEVVEAEIAGPRERYKELMADKSVIDQALAEGAERARALAQPVLARVRKAIGIG